MANLALHNPTNIAQADEILQGVITLYEMVFPGRVRAYYLTGSYTDGTAILVSGDRLNSSDLDLFIVFKGSLESGEAEKHAQLRAACTLISPFAIDAGVSGEDQLFEKGNVVLKLDSLLLYGEDIREHLSLMSFNAYLQYSISLTHKSFLTMRDTPSYAIFPLDYPDPAGEFYGYDWSVKGGTLGWNQGGTRVLVASIGRAVSALVALKTGRYVGKKSDSVKTYKELINDEWTTLAEDIYQQCKFEWGYLVPEATEARQQLKELCRQTLAFENYFLTVSKTWLLSQLKDNDKKGKVWAIQQLGKIIFSDPEIENALSALVRDADKELNQAASETLKIYQAIPK